MPFSSASPRILLTIVLGFILLVVAPAYGQALPEGVRAVDINAPLGGDGLSWGTAYRFLADALDEALNQTDEDPDLVTEIWVADTPNGQAYRPDLDETNGPPPDHQPDVRTETFQASPNC